MHVTMSTSNGKIRNSNDVFFIALKKLFSIRKNITWTYFSFACVFVRLGEYPIIQSKWEVGEA